MQVLVTMVMFCGTAWKRVKLLMQVLVTMVMFCVTDIICDRKRDKLLMQVFRVSSAKYESVALEKLRVWWHFLNTLGATSEK